jgi:hypothetical protein
LENEIEKMHHVPASPISARRGRSGEAPGLHGEGIVSVCTVKVARSALRIPLALWERTSVRETVIGAATYILRGAADAMIVRCWPGS